MNKEKVKSPKEFLEESGYGGYLPIYTHYSLSKFMTMYSNYVLESQREEIERKAYEAGQESTHNWKDLPQIETYDQWKENQEQKSRLIDMMKMDEEAGLYEENKEQ